MLTCNFSNSGARPCVSSASKPVIDISLSMLISNFACALFPPPLCACTAIIENHPSLPESPAIRVTLRNKTTREKKQGTPEVAPHDVYNLSCTIAWMPHQPLQHASRNEGKGQCRIKEKKRKENRAHISTIVLTWFGKGWYVSRSWISRT